MSIRDYTYSVLVSLDLKTAFSLFALSSSDCIRFNSSRTVPTRVYRGEGGGGEV